MARKPVAQITTWGGFLSAAAAAVKRRVDRLRSDVRMDIAESRAELLEWLVPLPLGQAAPIVTLVKPL